MPVQSISPLVLLCLAVSASAHAAPIFDKSTLDTSNSYDVSAQVVADDFELGSPALATGLQIYLVDTAENDNGQLDDFSGTLSWAIYSDGGLEPDSLLHSGTDSTVNLTDTGLQDGFNADIVRADLDLPSINLGAGIFWLAIHEGNWGSGSDGTQIWWSKASGTCGENDVTAVFTSTLTLPGDNWNQLSSGTQVAFTIVPEPSVLAIGSFFGVFVLVRRR